MKINACSTVGKEDLSQLQGYSSQSRCEGDLYRSAS